MPAVRACWDEAPGRKPAIAGLGTAIGAGAEGAAAHPGAPGGCTRAPARPSGDGERCVAACCGWGCGWGDCWGAATGAALVGGGDRGDCCIVRAAPLAAGTPPEKLGTPVASRARRLALPARWPPDGTHSPGAGGATSELCPDALWSGANAEPVGAAGKERRRCWPERAMCGVRWPETALQLASPGSPATPGVASLAPSLPTRGCRDIDRPCGCTSGGGGA
mmetsp:Transcript_118997/g.322875  ORF Transcript_118997/g.322875 Transcript_118997/m.322875 type:complete len:221 (+) Transcript_118997:277-939(+)